MLRLFAFSLLFFTFLQSGWAQAWEKNIELESFTNLEFSELEPTPDGGFILGGDGYLDNGSTLSYKSAIVKLDAYGEMEWFREYARPTNAPGLKGLTPLDTGGYAFNFQSDETRVIVLDQEGNTTNEIPIGGNLVFSAGLLMPTSDHALLGWWFGEDNIGRLRKFATDGSLLWELETSLEIYDGLEVPGGYIFSGKDAEDLGQQFGALRVNMAGEQQWRYVYPELPLISNTDGFFLEQDNDGNLWYSGYLEASITPGVAAKITEEGDLIDWFGLENINYFTKAIPDGEGGVYYVDVTDIYNADSTSIDFNVMSIKRANIAGELLWEQQLPSPNLAFSPTVFTKGNGYYGVMARGGTTDNSQAFVIKLEALDAANTATISGHVYIDHTGNCEATSTPAKGWTVAAQGVGTYYAYTNAEGYYEMTVPLGSYSLVPTVPNPYWSSCEAFPIILDQSGTFTEQDLVISPTVQCPYLEVAITTPFLRNCTPNTYYVHYKNIGTTVAEQVYIDVQLDHRMEVLDSELPFVLQPDGGLRFDLPDLEVFAAGTFWIETELNCTEAELGETICAEAHIFPDDFCGDFPDWSGASLNVEANCEEDSVIFIIQNIGNAPNTPGLQYIAIEDDVILMQEDVNVLAPQETQRIAIPGNGQMLRLEVDQEPFHPGFSAPSAAIEGCPVFNIGSADFFIHYPQNDGDHFIDIDCQPVIGSFDPNDKQTFPRGFGDQRLIEPNTELEYLIRFQNTGTDTAFRVVIRDTLSPLLEVASVRPGVSSHPFDFEIVDQGTLVFTFDPIALPDSNVNEPASHGFVKFNVKQKPDLPIGSTISNRAGIYFDFNEPIITNATRHQIGINFIDIISTDYAPAFSPNVVRVYPNPFHDALTLELSEEVSDSATFILLDVNGRQIWKDTVGPGRNTLKPPVLPKGVYFFQVVSVGNQLARGKLVAD